MALSVTHKFCISSADGFEANVIDHPGTQLISPGKMRLQLHFLCLAYALMSSHISSPCFSSSLFCSPYWHFSYRGREKQCQTWRDSGLRKRERILKPEFHHSSQQRMVLVFVLSFVPPAMYQRATSMAVNMYWSLQTYCWSGVQVWIGWTPYSAHHRPVKILTGLWGRHPHLFRNLTRIGYFL